MVAQVGEAPVDPCLYLSRHRRMAAAGAARADRAPGMVALDLAPHGAAGCVFQGKGHGIVLRGAPVGRNSPAVTPARITSCATVSSAPVQRARLSAVALAVGA